MKITQHAKGKAAGLAFLFLFLPSMVSAEGFHVSGWGAYGLVNMADFNQYIVDSFGQLEAEYTIANGAYVTFNGVQIAGIDAGYEFVPGLILGVRMGRIRCLPASISGTVVANPVNGRTGNFRIGFESSVTPYMVGGSLRLMDHGPWQARASLYLGYADGQARFDLSDSLGVLGTTNDVECRGSGIADDLSGELEYYFNPHIAIGFSIHFMVVRIASMTASEDIPQFDVFSDQPLQDRRGGVLAFDYSNIAAGAQLHILF